MIIYAIQHHGDLSPLIWLLKRIQHPRNQYIVSYDGPESKITELRTLVDALEIDAKRILVRQSGPIYWCGPSQAEGIVASMECAASFEAWDFFINLSGVCAPLNTQVATHEFLQCSLRDGIEAHLFSFRNKKSSEILPISHKNEIIEKKIGRLKLRGAVELIDYFSDVNSFPVRRATNRPFINCQEVDCSARVLHVSRPKEFEIEERLDYFISNGHYCGRAWYAFSRRGLELFLNFYMSKNSEKWRSIFFNCFQPDETFVQMALEVHNVLPSDKISRKNLHAFEGNPRNITDKDFSDVIGASGAFFIRKMDHANASRLKNWIELMV